MFGRSRQPDPELGALRQQLADFAAEASRVAKAAASNDFDERVDASRFSGELAEIAHDLNATMEAAADRTYWFENLLDSIPFPLSVTDMDMRWTFVNKPVEGLLGVKRASVLGKQCENWNADICRTANCGIARIRAGATHTTFKQQGMDFAVDVAYLTNRRGERVGHVEVVQETTPLVRSIEFQAQEAKRLVSYFQQMAAGDLAFSPQVADGDKYTTQVRENYLAIAQYLQETLSSLRTLVGDVQASSDRVAEASRQIEGATEQTAKVTQEVAATIQHVAADAQASAKSAGQVSASATDGSRRVTEMVAAMRQIEATVTDAGSRIQEMQSRSEKIGEIVETIDDIAEQTNLLALNAAIEAARAGEQGRGFAVVADEVRKLAGRSSEATRQIGTLIRDVQRSIGEAAVAMESSLSRVTDGTKVAESAGEALGDIATAAGTSNDQVKRISGNAEDVAAMTEEMSAQAQEVTASAQALTSMAEVLREQTTRFRLEARVEKAPGTPGTRKLRGG